MAKIQRLGRGATSPPATLPRSLRGGMAMSVAELIPLVISLSIFITVLAIGLDATFQDAVSLFRRPGLLIRSIVSMNVVMVLIAVAIAHLFALEPAIKIAIVTLAVSPVPPILPKKQKKAGGTGSYAIGLLVAAAICAIVLVPSWIELIGRVFGIAIHIPPLKVASILIVSTIVPLFAGMLIRHFAPPFAERAIKPVALIGGVLLLIGALPVLFVASKLIWAMIGDGVLTVVIVFALAGIIVGHFLGGPDPDERTVLALATSARHPGIAMAITGLNFPAYKIEVLAVILLYLIVAAIIAIPYMRWCKNRHAALTAAQRP
jgi:BASS family bile acid:Na+ symporter